MATLAQLQAAVISRTEEGKIPWEAISSPNGTTYLATYKGIIVLVYQDRVKLKYKGRSRIKAANMTTLRSAIETFLADNGEQADINTLYALMSS